MHSLRRIYNNKINKSTNRGSELLMARTARELGGRVARCVELRRVRPRRSALYMPGSRRRALEKARTLAADCIIMDCPLPSPPPFPLC